MRLLLAALFVCGGMMAAVVLLSLTGWFNQLPIPLIVVGLVLWFFILISVSFVVDSWLDNRLMSPYDPDSKELVPEQSIEELESQGLVEDTTYHARRAIYANEDDDYSDGPYYFVQLLDRSVLFLHGAYLYEIDEAEIDDGKKLPQKFPCTEFVLRRHKDKRSVLALVSGGMPFDWDNEVEIYMDESVDWIPNDGEIIEDMSYEEVMDAVRVGEVNWK